MIVRGQIWILLFCVLICQVEQSPFNMNNLKDDMVQFIQNETTVLPFSLTSITSPMDFNIHLTDQKEQRNQNISTTPFITNEDVVQQVEGLKFSIVNPTLSGEQLQIQKSEIALTPEFTTQDVVEKPIEGFKFSIVNPTLSGDEQQQTEISLKPKVKNQDIVEQVDGLTFSIVNPTRSGVQEQQTELSLLTEDDDKNVTLSNENDQDTPNLNSFKYSSVDTSLLESKSPSTGTSLFMDRDVDNKNVTLSNPQNQNKLAKKNFDIHVKPVEMVSDINGIRNRINTDIGDDKNVSRSSTRDSSDWVYDSVESDYSEYVADDSKEISFIGNRVSIMYSNEQSDLRKPFSRTGTKNKHFHKIVNGAESDDESSDERPLSRSFTSVKPREKEKRFDSDSQYYSDSQNEDLDSWENSEDFFASSDKSKKRNNKLFSLDFSKPVKNFIYSSRSDRKDKSRRNRKDSDFFSSEDWSYEYEYEYEYSDSEMDDYRQYKNSKNSKNRRYETVTKSALRRPSETYRRKGRYPDKNDDFSESTEEFWDESDNSEIDERGLKSKTFGENFGHISEGIWDSFETDSFDFDSWEDSSDDTWELNRKRKSLRRN